MGFHGGLDGKEICLQCRRAGVQSPGQEEPLEKEMATHSSILAWEIPWTEKPAGLQSMGPTSKLKLEIVKILKTEGYIKNFKKVTQDGVNTIRILLKYDEQNEPVIHGIKKISTPGRRVYSGYKDLPRVYNGYGTVIVSTSLGVTTGKKASEKMVGGELICTVW